MLEAVRQPQTSFPCSYEQQQKHLSSRGPSSSRHSGRTNKSVGLGGELSGHRRLGYCYVVSEGPARQREKKKRACLMQQHGVNPSPRPRFLISSTEFIASVCSFVHLYSYLNIRWTVPRLLPLLINSPLI